MGCNYFHFGEYSVKDELMPFVLHIGSTFGRHDPDILDGCDPEEVVGEQLQCLEGERHPGAGDVRVADVAGCVHGQGQDEHVDPTHLEREKKGNNVPSACAQSLFQQEQNCSTNSSSIGR